MWKRLFIWRTMKLLDIDAAIIAKAKQTSNVPATVLSLLTLYGAGSPSTPLWAIPCSGWK
ncbi:hypothetical protein GCM10019997_16580 [Prevotella corporis]